MFKNRKLEVRLVKDGASAIVNDAKEESTLTAEDYALIAEEALSRLGKKLLIGAVITIATVAITTMLTDAVNATIQNSLSND